MTGVPFSAASPASIPIAVCSAPPARVPSNVSLLTAPSTTSSAPMLTVTPSTAAMPSNAVVPVPAVVRTPAVAPTPVQTVPNVVGTPTSMVGHHQSAPDAASPDPLTVALLAQQQPSLPNYNGDNIEGDGENFSDWLERLELVVATCRWDNQTKLVNVATRLRGTASRFYQSCTPQQRSSYELVRALQSRFTPVRIQSVQSSIFHERKHKDGESVDDYAQDLQSCSIEPTPVHEVVVKQRLWEDLFSQISLLQD